MSVRYLEAVSQENNGVEGLLQKIAKDKIEGYNGTAFLETCGPSSLEAILLGLGVDLSFLGPAQPSDVFTVLFHDARYMSRETLAVSKPVHRYIDYYPELVGKLFPSSVKAVVKHYKNGNEKALIEEALAKDNTGVMVNLINPGHYIALLSIDEAGLITYNDSWMNNYWNRSTERIRKVHIDAMTKNVKYGILEVSAP